MTAELKLQSAVDTLKSVSESHTAEVCGLWLWVQFNGKPSNDTRSTLKSAGFRWARRKEKWYYAAVPSKGKRTMSMAYIRTKYGSEELDE